MNACFDNYDVAAVEHGEDAKRKKRIKPKAQVMHGLKAALQQVHPSSVVQGARWRCTQGLADISARTDALP